MMFAEFQRVINAAGQREITFILPNGDRVPSHFHITDVGSVFQHFIDCGGQTRSVSFVQIQLWLGADTEHRLTAATAAKILQQSYPVLRKLPGLADSEVAIEYQTDVTARYDIHEATMTDSEVLFSLTTPPTQCWAAIRHLNAKGDEGGGHPTSTACCG